MASFAGLTSALGAAAQGGLNGYRMAESDQRANADAAHRAEDQGFQNEQRVRARKQWGEQDSMSAALQDADGVGRKAYEEVAGSASHEDAMLAGLTARTQALAAASKQAPGITQEWLKSWSDTSKLRAQVRQSALDKADAQFRATGDPAAFMSVYNYIDDGNKATGITKTPDGKFALQLVENATGKEQTKVMDAAQFQQGIEFLRDPNAVRAHEAKIAAIKAQNDGMLARIKQTGLNSVNTAEVRADATRDAAKISAGARITAAQLRGSGSGSGGRGGSNGVQSVQKNGDGTSTIIMRDGSSKVLTDDNGAPIVGDHAVRAAMQGVKIISSSVQGMQNTAEQNAEAGAGLVKNVSRNMQPAPGLNSGGTQVTTPKTGKPTQSFWGDK